MAYTPKVWADGSAGNTPITAAELNRMETGIVAAGPMFNVRNYGAVGDGVADDRAAIQAALDAANTVGGGTVYMPRGTYRVSKFATSSHALRIYSNIRLIGAGMGATTIMPVDNIGDNVATIRGESGIQNAEIAHLGIDGNKANQPAANDESEGINLKSPTRCFVYHCYIRNTRADGIDFDDATACAVTDCVITDCRLSAIHLAGETTMAVSCVVSRCHTARNAYDRTDNHDAAISITGRQNVISECTSTHDKKAIALHETSRSTVVGCTIYRPGGTTSASANRGIQVTGASGSVVIANCTVEGWGVSNANHDGISLVAGGRITVIGCSFISLNNGVQLMGVGDTSVIGCTALSMTNCGILVTSMASASDAWLIQGCTAVTASGHTIRADVGNGTIQGCLVRGSGGQGIDVRGGNTRVIGNTVAGAALFALRLFNSPTNCMVEGNDLTGTSGAISTTGSGHRINQVGLGSPEGVIHAGIGSQWRRTDGTAGATLYIKETGTGNTGWRAV